MSALPFLRRRRKRRSSERQRSQGRLTRGILAVGLLLAVTLGLLILGGALAYASVTADLPALGLLPQLLDPHSGSLLQPTRLYDRSGAHLLAVLAERDAPRVYVPLDASAAAHLPDTLARATVALVDPQFWSHSGCQWSSLANPDTQQRPTIAQKLAADLLLWDEPAGLRRAARECLLAAQLTARFGREKILEWYLNSANYGHFAYGAEAAARLYLGKSVSQLNLAEAALLASVNELPAINPLDAPQAALQREREALDLIQARGQAPADEVELARLMPLDIQPAAQSASSAPTFTALALSQLENRFNRARAERGGMLVVTTLDFDLQRRAECALQTELAHLNDAAPPACDGAAALPPLPPGQNAPQAEASAAVLDPRTGQVLALVGDSSSGTQSAFLTPHRPGTLITPFVYLAGFTRGLSPASLVWDIPPAGSGAGAANAAGQGPMRVRTALANDSLVPAGQVFEQMGADLVRRTMLPFGLELSADSLDTLLQTENRYSVIQMAHAYAVFAAQGALFGQETQPAGGSQNSALQPGSPASAQPAFRTELEPSTILAVRSLDGQTYADWSLPGSEQIVSAQLSYLVTDMLGANLPNLGRPLAFKRGETLDHAGTWAVGYTPHRVVAVWMGGAGLSQRPVEGVWSAIMHAASLDVPPDGWTQPAGVLRLKVCDPSGMLPTEACPNLVDEVFIDGNQPVQADTLFRSYAIDIETGFLATVFTPPQLVEKRVYMLVPFGAQPWARAANLPLPPSQYDTLQAPVPNPAANIISPRPFASVQGKVQVRGTAGGEGFSYYRLQVGQGLNPETWLQIGSNGNSPVNKGTLVEWDTSGLQGLYSLQLLVVRADGSLQTASLPVIVNNP